MSIRKCLSVAAVCSLMMCACACAQEKDISSGNTLGDLMVAYNGEVNANAKYIAFGEKANDEGYDAIAALFRAAALAEQVHFERHAAIIKKLGGTPKADIATFDVKSTRENVEAAIAGETYESTVMYPEFLKQAQKERNKEAIDAFEDAQAAEAVHARAYARMLKNIDLSKGLTKEFYVCPKCGNIVDALVFQLCPICKTSKEKFKKVMEY